MVAIHQRCRPELVLFCSPGKTEFLLTKSCKRTATTTCKIFPHQTPIHGGILTSTLGPQSAFPSYPWRGKSQATWWAAPRTSAAGGLWYQLAVQLRSLLPLTGGLLPATDWWTGRETVVKFYCRASRTAWTETSFPPSNQEKKWGGSVRINLDITLTSVHFWGAAGRRWPAQVIILLNSLVSFIEQRGKNMSGKFPKHWHKGISSTC